MSPFKIQFWRFGWTYPDNGELKMHGWIPLGGHRARLWFRLS